jgi:hypothetical protein
MRITNCIPDKGECKIICGTQIKPERKVVLWFQLHNFFLHELFSTLVVHISHWPWY